MDDIKIVDGPVMGRLGRVRRVELGVLEATLLPVKPSKWRLQLRWDLDTQDVIYVEVRRYPSEGGWRWSVEWTSLAPIGGVFSRSTSLLHGDACNPDRSSAIRDGVREAFAWMTHPDPRAHWQARTNAQRFAQIGETT